MGRLTTLHSTTALMCLAWASAAGAAQGQSASPPSSAPQVEQEIVVTGTNLRGARSTVPTDVLTGTAIRQLAVPTVTDIFKNLPANIGAEFNSFTFRQAQTRGTAQVNLRGLGLGSTLTLINGRRTVLSASSADDGNQFVDINTIPVSALERVEIVKTGASAIYGSDAVAGVVNFITRDAFRGAEVSATYQRTTSGPQSDFTVSGILGLGDETISTMIAGELLRRTRLNFVERAFTGRGTEIEFGSGKPGGFVLTAPSPRAGFTTLPVRTPVVDPFCTAAGGILPSTAPLGLCGADARAQQDLIPDEDRYSLLGRVNIAPSAGVTLFLEGGFSSNQTRSTSVLSLPGAGASGQILVPPTNPFNVFGVPALFIGRPLGLEAGVADSETLSETWRGVVGGEVELGRGWALRADYVAASNAFRYDFRDLYRQPFLAALAGTGFTSPNGQVIAPGIFLNVFGSSIATPATAGNSPELVAALGARPSVTFRSTVRVFDLTLSGPLLSLPEGPVALAAGYQRRRNTIAFDADSSINTPGTLLFSFPLADFARQATTVDAGFAEVAVPVARGLELRAAGRFEDYGGTIGSTFDPQASLRWTIVPGLTVRASGGSSFRAPTPLQTRGRTSGVQPLTNPCTGQQAAVGINTVGNPALTPERSDSYSAGAEYRRAGVRAGIDYYRYDYRDVITRTAADAYIRGAQCVAGRPVLAGVTTNAAGGIVSVDLPFINAGSIKTDGLDWSLGYTLPTGGEGALSADLSGTWVTRFDIQETRGGAVIDALDNRNIRNFARSTPDVRGTFVLAWSNARHRIAATARYTDSYTDDRLTPTRIDSLTTFDLQYALTLPWGGRRTEVSLGVLNVTDEDPPFVNDRGGYDPLIADPRGRMVYVGLRQRL